METYLFKFSACLAVLWLIYILFLEREQMHHLKRFYLLGAFVISLIIPLLTITHYIEPVVITNFETTPSLSPITYSPIEINQEEPPFWNLEKALYLIYALGALLFAIRFMFNLISMFRRISRNEQINTGDFIYVLLKDYRIPHSFFKYLFFNKTNYESNAIPMEVQLHEETHASQWHSLDIVLIEMLQIVFWFHPLVYLLKHHIKLNHEFLADEAVLNHGIDAKNYQTILLQFSSNTEKYQLSSAINYSSIKKRFTVMKTRTSKTRMWLSSLLILPIIAILFYSFAEARYVERAPIEKSELIQKEVNKESEVTTYHELTEQYLTALSASIKGTQFDYSELKILYTKTYQLYESFSKSEIVTYNILPPPPLPLENTPEKILTISIDEDSKLFVNNKLSNFEFLESVLKNLYVPDNYTIKFENQSSPKMMEKTLLLLKEYGLLHVVNSSKTGDQQEKATPKEVAEYNIWAKKIHKTIAEAEANNTKEYPIIKLKDLNRYKGIYSKMTAAQKENSQVWPKLPPMPIPPPATSIIKINGETLFCVHFVPKRYYNKSGYLVDRHGKTINGNIQVNASDVIPGQYITKVYSDDKVVITFKDNQPERTKGAINIPRPNPKSKDKTDDNQNKKTIHPIEITIKKDKSLELNGKLVSLENFVDDVKKLNQHLILEQRREHVFASILVESNDHMSLAKDIQEQLKKADIYNCIVGYNETKRKAGLPIKHFNMNAGLTVEEAKKEREKMLEANNNGESLDKLIDSLNKKDNNKWSYTVETSFVETFDTIEGEMDNLKQTLLTNPSFLEYIIDMVQQGATFYIDGKKITANEAKAIAKNNKGKSTEMITQKDANGKYMVKLYSSEKNKLYARSINLKILGNNSYLIDGIKATKKTFIDVFNQLHQDINPETRNNILNIQVSSADEISNKEVWFIYNSLQDYGFYRIVTPNQEINRAKGNTPFAIESSNRN